MIKAFITSKKSRHNLLGISAVIMGLFITGCSNEPTDRRITQMDPEQAFQLARSIEGTVNPEIAEGLSLKLWGVDSLVADPISIHIDDKGRLYYARTNRQKNSEFDIRGHRDWEIESIRLQTVEDKRAFLRRELSPENSHRNEWLADLNGDGSHDWRDMTIEKEHIYRIEDTSGDGVADLTQLVVEDFNDETTDVAGAVLTYGDDLFVGVAPDMWRMRDTNGDGIADQKTSISHGYGVHIGFGGHGMSGLTVGPDGKVYWGIGDIGFNGEDSEGKLNYANEGVIVRANPDGSDFEVFASGVRNTHEFVFDEYGNLISVDNDGDHPGERERLVYIVNGSDTGWRINWQFGKYRDPDNNTYKVWMDEELYKPRFPGQAAYITPTIVNFINGPAGMVYNPGTAMGSRWKNTFFVAEFVGNPVRSGVHAFKLNPKGAGFELGESDMILKGILATGLDFGPDGALYVADWIEGWGTKGHGRIWKLDDEKEAASAERQLTKNLLAENFSSRNEEELGDMLKNPDMRVRKKAQFELARRGDKGADQFQKSINQQNHQLARVHGIWGISQLARGDKKYASTLLPLLKDRDPEIRAQAAKWIGDIRYREAGDQLMPLLKDSNSRARFFAAEALGRIAYEPAIQPIIELLRDNDDEDVYLRHVGSLALARIGKAAPIVALSNDQSAAVRMGAVIALRRLRHPDIVRFLNDQNEYIVTEAARAINDDHSIEKALPALGNLLLETQFTNEPLLRRAINANLRVGTEKSMQNLLDYTLKANAPENMKVEAIQAIGTWARPSVLDRVDGRYRGEINRNPTLVREKASAPLVQLLSHRDKSLRLNAVLAIGKLVIEGGSNHLFGILTRDRDADVRVAAINSLALMQDAQMDRAIETALSDRDKRVRVRALDLLAKQDISAEFKANLLANVIEKGSVEEKQAALITLGGLPSSYTQGIFENLLDRLDNGKLAQEVHLELAEAIESTQSAELKRRHEVIKSEMGPDAVMASYQASLYGGDAEIGRTIFFQNQAGQCMRCHSYDDMGSNVGPRINGVAARLSRQQILESLIDPSKDLAPGYGMVGVDLKNGKSITGILQEENNQSLAVKVGSQADTVIRKQDIEKRTNYPSSMPDMKDMLTAREIRDLVSFLAQQTKDEMISKQDEKEGEGHGR